MALTDTKTWAEVDALLNGGGEVDLSVLRRGGLFRRLVDEMRADDFPFGVSPDTDGQSLHVHAAESYNYSVPALFTVMTFTPLADLAAEPRRWRATYASWNDRLDAPETRTWDVAAEGLELRLGELFDEADWPRIR